jgi:ferric-dicitrate binding protein FerR (iron transport regulator)
MLKQDAMLFDGSGAGSRWNVKKRTDRVDRLDPLTRDALAWVMRLKSGEATLADAEQLIDWRAKSAEHERAYRDAVKCWQAIGRSLVGNQPTGPGRPRRKSKATSPS